MSSLSFKEKKQVEELLGMKSGYVSDFSNSTFEEFVFEHTGKDIHAQTYSQNGTSKANKLRSFWKLEPDYTVGQLLGELIDYHLSTQDGKATASSDLILACRQAAYRLKKTGPDLSGLQDHVTIRDAIHLGQQIERMKAAVESDPALAIGTAKELIESCCKTILEDEGIEYDKNIDLMPLIKKTVKELRLTPDDIPDTAKGAQAIKQLLHKLAAIVHEMGELRGLYGTGHGKDGRFKGLQPRHARLATGMAGTLTLFLFETHHERQANSTTLE